MLATTKTIAVPRKKYLHSLVWSIVFFIGAITLNYFSAELVNTFVTAPVPDIFLSNVPIHDTSMYFVYGPVVFWAFICVVAFFNRSRIPFLLKTISLFVVIRAGFVCLTHLGPYSVQNIMEGRNIITQFSTSNDFFFSGHTGLPYLMAYMFWDLPVIRVVCILSAIFFAFVVLLGHYHYSIDVVAAFFITSSIYRISEMVFRRELAFFKS